MMIAVRSASSVRNARCTRRSDGMSSDDVGLVEDQHRGVGEERANATSWRCPAERRAPFWCTSVS